MGDFQRLKKADQEIVKAFNDFLDIKQIISAANKQHPYDDRNAYLHLFQPLPNLAAAADAGDGRGGGEEAQYEVE